MLFLKKAYRYIYHYHLFCVNAEVVDLHWHILLQISYKNIYLFQNGNNEKKLVYGLNLSLLI